MGAHDVRLPRPRATSSERAITLESDASATVGLLRSRAGEAEHVLGGDRRRGGREADEHLRVEATCGRAKISEYRFRLVRRDRDMQSFGKWTSQGSNSPGIVLTVTRLATGSAHSGANMIG